MSGPPRLVPWQLKAAVRRVLDAPERRRWLADRSAIAKSETAEPVLSFGGVLDDGRPVRGGAVKLLSLRNRFRCDEQSFNILYLVSSAQPRFADDLVRECRRKNIAIVWNQNGVGYTGWAGAESERHNAPMRKLRAQADYVVYQSEFCRQSADKFLGNCGKSSCVLLNPVDLEKFSPLPAPPRPVAPRLLAMGTHSYRDRVFSAVEAVRVLREQHMQATLTVAGPLSWRGGEAETRAHIRTMALSEAVRLRPAFGQDEAPGLYRAHDILIHPKYLDPCPTVVAEALACGLPVVGSASGGLPEMTNADCARLLPVPLVWDRMVTPGGVELAEAVRELWWRIGDASRAARACAKKKFDAGVWTEAHREIFGSLLAR